LQIFPAKWGKSRQIKAPLTFILSRKGREEMKGKILKDPLTLTLSRGVERKDEKKRS
jgi:hypothetical protein